MGRSLAKDPKTFDDEDWHAMRWIDRLDRLHAWARGRWWLHDFTTFTRILLAIGFIPPGLTKVLGQPFTSIGHDSPIGRFFDAFFHAQAFYAFVGWMQVIAGLLLLWPRTALLGGLLYLPIIVNIEVITLSLQFRGTWVIAGLMTLACLYLLAWDAHRVRAVLPVREEDMAVRTPWTAPGRLRYTWFGMVFAGGMLTLAMRGLVPRAWLVACPIIGLLAVGADAVRVLRQWRTARGGQKATR